CLDVTEEVLEEAIERHCNLIVTHHPLLFKGLKEVTGRTATERIVIRAIRENVAIYSAHTNLDSAWEGVSHEIAHILHIHSLRVLDPKEGNPNVGLGVIGDIQPTPKLEFLRKIKDAFKVRSLRYSGQSPQLVVRKVAVCGGAGASLIRAAIAAGADMIITGDVKYHDFTTYGLDIIIADIGHYESELCTKELFSRIIRSIYPECVTYFAESETNPVKYM
ncbi:MAG: Nif3-like dinuclear metal center hexameric protein, partial [Muribaculaceae bacterium]|nr:Nif3-like dinuclear metal center hexameric protein [Muribaculaceae bacterium]